MSSSNKASSIVYSVATRKNRDAARKALTEFFYPEEPLTLAYRYGREVTVDDLENSLAFLDQGTVTLATVNDQPDGNVVGIAIGGPSNTALQVTVETQKFTDVMAFLKMVSDRSLPRALGSRPCYNLHCLAVHPAFRGRSIARRLVQEQLLLAKSATFDAFTADATARASAQLLRQLGMQEISRMRFDQYRNERGETVFDTFPDAEVITLEQLL
ncbi:uncharacterized protein LOC131215965 [Anopheles bellator]|uniref:uncharacterized protein LOC131215965 n=1 Tax=Anopheles bellator TaxID=139047 RepID=UPI002648A355|nr:uncharacterized protein LOC131215965 [Anopheles bellator]